MKALPFLRGAGVFLFLVLLHYTVRPLVGTRVNADFLLIAVMLTALDVRPGAAAAIGFATGLISDSLAPSSFGAGALSLSIVGFTASWLRAAVFGDNLLLQAFFIAAGSGASTSCILWRSAGCRSEAWSRSSWSGRHCRRWSPGWPA